MIRQIVFALAAVGLATPAFAAGDATHGKVIFNQCLICHTTEPGKWKVGPTLFGIVGRPAASEPGYHYSSAMKDFAANVVNKDGKGWTDEDLNAYLENPMGLVHGTKMTFPGLKRAQDRADIIAYLDTLH